MNEKSGLLQLVKEGYGIYIATQPAIFKELTISEELKPHIRFFDCLLEENRDWYKSKITELNRRVFGPLSMPTADWVDHHFGIAAGVTLGLLDLAGEPISMMRFCRHFEINAIHEWTLLVAPEYEARGFGKATLSLGCELSKNKEKISFTTQLDNSAIALYLHLTNEENPLELLAIGFHHTHPNSILAVANIPEDSNSIMKEYKMPSIDRGTLLTESTQLIPGKYCIRANDLEAIKRISKDLGQDSKYKIIGWCQDWKEKGIEVPLTMIEKIK